MVATADASANVADPQSRRATLRAAVAWALALATGNAVLPAASAADKVVVARPRTGPALFHFDLPTVPIFQEAIPNTEDFDQSQVAYYIGPDDYRVIVGPDSSDYIRSKKQNTAPARLKTIKYEISEFQDDLECKMKLPEADSTGGSSLNKVVHKWFRLLREPESQGNRSFLMILQVPEDKVAEYGPDLVKIRDSFALGPA